MRGGEIGIALMLDLLLGDPLWLPHPVRGIGWVIGFADARLRRAFKESERLAGLILLVCLTGSAALLSWSAVILAGKVSPVAGVVVSGFLVFFSMAPRDLAVHAFRVYRALKSSDLEGARRSVGMIVGRDVANLDEKGVVRACVESVAENTVDGVIAPLFFAFLGGAPAAMAYRAVNTLDSMIGYREAPYTRFGWASARLDDLVNFLPARIAAFLIPVAGGLTGGSLAGGYRILFRDGRKHESPNAGLPEAAMAGILGVQLKGPAWYRGVYETAPSLGDGGREVRNSDILSSILIMAVTTLLFVLLFGSLMWRLE